MLKTKKKLHSAKNVFIINSGTHDYSAAQKFGKLIVLSKGYFNRHDVGKIARQFAVILNQSNPDDYLLVSGSTIMNSVASAIFAHTHGVLNLLIFKKLPDKDFYVERHLEMSELMKL